MDPNTGSIHVPFGDITGTKMVRYDVKKNTIVTIPSPPVMGGGVMLSYHSVVWRGSGLVDTYLLYGGKTNTSNFNMGLWAYDPSNSWRLTPTSGPSPTGAITGHCMIQSQDDNDIFVVFGGQDAQGISLGSIYFYDITTSVWTQGSPVDASEARWGMACAVAEGQLVVWGGMLRPMLFNDLLS
ncbi:hypothetical protein EC991_001556 [Linnemannia zychae]|nr:hypothetical protein EC991_001556 [Linnemannia zychae]